MDSYLEKAKKALGKNFCFMKWQEVDAIKQGREIMTPEDITYILSLDCSLVPEHFLDLDGSEDRCFSSFITDTYKPNKLFETMANAKGQGLKAIRIYGQDVTNSQADKIRKMGGYIEYEGAGSTKTCEIYLNEEFHIQAKISSFKHLFGGLATVAQERII